MFTQINFPQEIVDYIISFYFAVTAPLVAISSTTTIALLRGTICLRINDPHSPRRQSSQLVAYPIHKSIMPAQTVQRVGESSDKAYPRWADATAIACANRFAIILVGGKVFECNFGVLAESPEVYMLAPELVEMPVEGRTIAVSCGDYHAAAITYGPLNVLTSIITERPGAKTPAGNITNITHTISSPGIVHRLFLWGNNSYGQLAKSGSGTSEPQLVWRGNAVSVVCLSHATLLLTNGEVLYSGLISPYIPRSEVFLKLSLSEPIGIIKSIQLMCYRVVFRDERGALYAIIGDTDGRVDVGIVDTDYFVERPDHIHNKEHMARIYAFDLTLDHACVCKWSELGGR